MNYMKLRDKVPTPTYGTEGSAGMDFYLPGDYSFTLQPGFNKIDLGIAMEVPKGFVLMLKGKSGIAIKHELMVLGGIIDSDYRGEISLLCFYPKAEPAKLLAGSKVVQGLLLPIGIPDSIDEVKELTETVRGSGGFGSTDIISEETLICPHCGSKNITTTLVGFTGNDKNIVSCQVCGRKGVAWKWTTIPKEQNK